MNHFAYINILLIIVQLAALVLVLYSGRLTRKARETELQDARRIANIAAFALTLVPNVELEGTVSHWGVVRAGMLVAQDPDLRVAIDTAIVELHRNEVTL